MKDALQRSDDQLSYNLNYPYQTWYTWAAIVGVATIVNVLSRIIALVTRYYSPKSKSNGSDAGSSTWRLPAALVNTWRVIAYRSTVNFGRGYTMNVLELFLTAGYFAALFAWSFAHTSNAELGDLPYAADYIANRLGTIATAQFPLVTVLGTKNNVISFLTGIAHEKLNYLHRMTARVAFVILWMHAGRWMPRSMLPAFYYEQAWMSCGVLGLVALTLLCFASIRPAREKAYEWFLWGHFALVFIFLVGAYIHVKECLYEPWIAACFAIWAFDRLVRVLRVLYFSLASLLSPKTPSPPTARFETRATVEHLTPHHAAVRVCRPRGFHWAPGQMVYLMAPGVSVLPWEAHPFTVACVDESRYVGKGAGAGGGEGDESSLEKTEGVGEEGEGRDEMVFIVGLMKGFTGRLGKRVAGAERARHVVALVEGPYGDGEDVLGYDTVVLVAGGTGVAWTLPVMIDTIRRLHCSYRKCRKLVFIWAIRDRDHVSWVAEPLKRVLPLIESTGDIEVCIRIFITCDRSFSTPNVLDDQPQPPTPDSLDAKSLEEGTAADADVDAVLGARCVEVAGGRPGVADMVRAEIGACRERRGGDVFVGVCGSASLAEAVKVGARGNPLWGRDSVLRGGPNVVLKVESFGYA